MRGKEEFLDKAHCDERPARRQGIRDMCICEGMCAPLSSAVPSGKGQGWWRGGGARSLISDEGG